MLSYPSGMTMSSRALNLLADLLRGRRNERGTRWRKLPAGRQALLVLAHLRKNETYADLACGFRGRHLDGLPLHPRSPRPPLQPEQRGQTHRRSSDPRDRQRMIRLAKAQ